MKIVNEQILLETNGNCDIINISEEVSTIIKDSGLTNGTALVFIEGSTASITTTEYEPGLKKDIPEILDKLIPFNNTYHHNNTWGDNNGHAHIRAAIIGCSVSVPFMFGSLSTGTWQQIVLIDFDERKRKRKVIVQLIGE